jgi:hypothetical protein
MRPTILLILAAASTIVSATRGAHAEPADVEAIIQHALELRRQRHDDEAAAELRRAYAISGSPRALAQLALAEEALGAWLDAERDLTTALDSPSDRWIALHESRLRESLALAKSHIGSLRMRSDVGGAAVWCNGEPIGILPLRAPLRLLAGPARLEVRAEGYLPWRKEIDIPAGGEVDEAIALEPTPAPVVTLAPADRAPAAALATQPSVLPPSSPELRVVTRAPSTTQRTAGWIVLAGGGAAIAGGLVATLKRADARDTYNGPECSAGGARPSVLCADVASSFHTYNAWMIAGYGVGGAALATGLVLMFTAPDGPKEPKTACAPSLGGVMCSGSF